MAKKPGTKTAKSVETLVHEDETRYNTPTAEMEPVVQDDIRSASYRCCLA